MERGTQRRRIRKDGATLAIATGLVMGALGGTAFAGGHSGCSQNDCGTYVSNGGSYGSTGHYVSSPGGYHDFSTYGHGGRNDRP